MFNKSANACFAGTAGPLLRGIGAALCLALITAGAASAAGIKVVPSAPKVSPGESFYADIVVEDIPSEGLSAVQFRLNVSAPGSPVTAVSDTLQGLPVDVSVSTPLLIGAPAAGRSGIGDFFWNAKGSHGILMMENETLQNGYGQYTFGHTSGASLPSGSGPIARFHIGAGKDVAAEKIVISLSDVALLEGGAVYPLESNVGATVDLKCYTQVPDLTGMSNAEAAAALSAAKLTLGTVYEMDNTAGTYELDSVLIQSANAGTTVLCETPVDVAINTAPAEPGGVQAADKPGDESGTIVFSWVPSPSPDAAGYRIYSSSGLRLAEIGNASSTGAELSGQPMGTVLQYRVTAYDSHGNESAGAVISAMAADDVAPRITVGGVEENAYYRTDVLPVITIQESAPAVQEITLNGAAYDRLPITTEGGYLLRITATDTSGNSSVKEIGFTIDKTAPAITVAGIEKDGYYHTDLSPVISVTDANPETMESLLNGSAYASGAVITAESSYELLIQATDKAGNTSSERYPFHIDKTVPVSSIEVGSPKHENGGTLYVGGQTAFTLNGTDAGTVVSGVARLEYRANSGAWSLYQAPVTLAGLDDGTIAMDYRAADRAGNVEDFHSISVTLDATAPLTTLTFGQPRYVDAGGAVYVTQNTAFSLSATDALSGVASTEYKVYAGEWMTDASFTIASEGAHTILYRSKDNLGNSEPDRSSPVTVDNTAPVTTITTGDPSHTGADGKLYVTSASTFTLAATDNLSGVAATEYRIDGGAWASAAPFTIAGEGEHAIEYYSRDNVTNAETIRTLAVIVDNAPPATTITTGDPKHAGADGKLYVTSASTFTLAATDNLSGVAATEYRIDNGAWTAAAPFTVAGEGEHIIEYRSRDNVANAEAVRTLAVIVDDTAPAAAAAAGTPQYQADGKLYVAAATNITITAGDAASGVKRIEYGIDGGDWNVYAGAFTLNAQADGGHAIRYRSSDNVGNIEEAGELAVILDTTPPQTAVSASDQLIDGVVNTVSPSTFFTLSAEDALSGVRSVAYRIGDGPWQAYTGSFSLAGMGAGQYSIAYKATDNVLNEEAEKTIAVRLLVMEVEKIITADTAVLIGMEGGKADLERKQADAQRLGDLLASLGVEYLLAGDMDQFTAALRSGRYGTYILIDVKEPLVGEEVREAVRSGKGLIFVKTSPEADPFLDDVFGVKFTGRTTNDNLTVDLLSSPISAEGTLQTAGKSVVSTIASESAQVFARAPDKHATHPSIVFNQYGQGRALLYTFDLPGVGDQPLASALLIGSMNFVRPAAQTPRALGSVPIRITLTNAAVPADVTVKETFPAGAAADTIVPGATPGDNTLTWTKSLASGERAAFRYTLTLPDAAGDYLTETAVSYDNNGSLRPYGTYQLVLNVRNSCTELRGKIIDELRGLEVNSSRDADLLTKAVDDLLSVDEDASTRKEAENNIRYIVKSIDGVRSMTIDTSSVRADLDELLMIWERKWYLMEPEG